MNLGQKIFTYMDIKSITGFVFLSGSDDTNEEAKHTLHNIQQ